MPLAPRRYNYPALVPPALHEACLFEAEDEFVSKLRRLLLDPPPARSEVRASAARFAWQTVIHQWDEAIDRLASRDFATREQPEPSNR